MKKVALIMGLVAVAAALFAFAPLAGGLCGGLLAILAPARISTRDLEKFAETNFSSFDGDDEDDYLGDEDFYTGFGDDAVDFGDDASSFADDVNSSRKFVMTLTNANAAARIAYISPGSAYSVGMVIGVKSAIVDTTITNEMEYPNGFVRDGSFNDKNGNAGLTASGSPKQIALFLSWIQKHPVQIAAMKIQSSVAEQMDQIITYRSTNPFETPADKYLYPGNYLDQNSYRDKTVVFSTPGFIIGGDIQVEYPILQGTTTITFFAGGAINARKTLTKKIQRASSTINTAGLKNIQKLQRRVVSKARTLGKGGR